MDPSSWTRLQRAGRRAAALLAWALLLPALAAAEPPTCQPWPGEPAPLPSLTDPDPLRAEWALLRSRELTAVARSFETLDPLRARQLWRRLLCMDPSNDEALAGVLRAPAVQVHRPPLRDEPFETGLIGEAFASLSAPIGVQVDRSEERREEAAAARLRELRQALEVVEGQVRGARFDEALGASRALRTRLESAPRGSVRTDLLVRTEVLAATSELALGRRAEAVTSLERALAANPALELDPTTTSPKVMRALEAARAGATP